ncbi:OmpA family protein [Hydrogenovibrio sp. JE_KL2]|uniref:OmpA family protein n=1 Tax=Hydrogenovibrio sp. JE_KL2 TaxID=2651188 RepID=UPI00156218DA|nr:OmpA family protein [Hydrogenovibrio sp. JE_KL2]
MQTQLMTKIFGAKSTSKTLMTIGALSIFSVMSLSGCSTMPKKSSDAGDETATSQTEGGAAGSSAADEKKKGVEVIGASGANGLNGQDINGSNLNGEQAGQNGAEQEKVYEPIIYFGYDQSEVDDTGVDIAKYYAKILVDNPQESVKLIGNTDERGTPGYNLALGEKRAKAVAQIMMLYGVSQAQIDVVSMGEEQPAVDGHTEAAWQKNRRVQIEIKQ